MPNAQEFLVQEYQRRKERNPNFSLRAFAKWLDISPAQLSQMLAAKRPVTLNTFKKISDRLGLSPQEKKSYMTSLLAEKSLIETPRQKKTLHLEEDQFRVIADWYHFAILSLTRLPNAKSDPRWVARRLGIGVAEAHLALRRLERLGVLETKPRFRQIGEPLDVVSEAPSEAIRKYHKQNLDLAAEKIETVPVSLRQFQSVSFGADPAKLEELKKLIDGFLETATETAEQHPPREVYHLNVQLFPVTQTKESLK
jgi:uncharacterized protein (TIGR02147 family)